MKLLIAEDEKDLNDILKKKLALEGYHIDQCYDGETAFEYLEYGEYDAVILDIMMPKMNGLEVVKKIRSRGDLTPVLFLTAKDTVADRVVGLDVGGDDYLVKPFSFEELMARIRVITRRAAGHASNILTVGDLSVDCETHRVRRGEKEINVSAKEFSILQYMIRNQGIVLSREKIENNSWDFESMTGSNVVDVYIRYLRKKIDEGYETKFIHTVRGAGYVIKEEE